MAKGKSLTQYVDFFLRFLPILAASMNELRQLTSRLTSLV